MESTTTTTHLTSKPATSGLATTELIHRYTIYAGLAGLIPVPPLGMAAVGFIQFDMVKQICRKYSVDFKAFKKKAFIVALGGTFLARIGASWLAAIPFFGFLIGGIAMAAMSAGSTYAIGHLLEKHFDQGGTPETFNLKAYKGEFEKLREEGKKVLQGQKVNLEKQAEVKIEKTPECQAEKENASHKLEGLEQMYADGVITKEEYETTKARILAAV